MAGIGATLVVFFVIGFFVLLGIVLKGDDSANKAAANPSGNVAGNTAGNQPPPPAQPTQIQVAEVTDADWVKGNRDAKISIIEFSDTECPFCKRFHPTLQRLLSEYPNDVNWVYRHFPLATLHAKAPKEAEATECAGELGGNDGFWAFLDRLYEITPSNDGLLASQLPEIAQEVGLDADKFSECLDSGRFEGKVAAHYSQATQAGGQGTPYSVIVAGDEKIPVSGAVPYEQLKAIVESVL